MTEPLRALSPELVAVAYTSRQLAELHRVAQEKLGLAAGLVAFTAFEDVNVLNPTMQAEWFARIVSVTVALRRISRRLAARYYNLARAIETQSAYPDIDGRFGAGSKVPMSTLYQEMGAVLNEVINVTSPAEDVPASSNPDSDVEDPVDRLDEIDRIIEDVFTDLVPETDSGDWIEEIDIEDFDWPEDDSDDPDFLDEFEQEMSERISKFVADSRGLIEGPEVDEERLKEVLDIHADEAGALADAGVMQEGRSFEQEARLQDDRVKAYFRATGANPCAFCAMLASRGAVYYSRESAGGVPDTAYHPNCHCRVIAIWLNRPYYTKRDLFFMNNWAEVTRGLGKTFTKGSTSAAYKAWRKWLAEQYRQGNVPAQDDFANRQL